MLQWTLKCIYIFKIVLLPSSGEYLDMKLLDHMANLYSIVSVSIFNSAFLQIRERVRQDWEPFTFIMGFPCGSAGKESACNEGDWGLTPGLGRSLGKGKGYPLQFSGLKNSIGKKKKWNSIDCIVLRITKGRTRLSDFHFHGYVVILIHDFKAQENKEVNIFL